MKACLFDAALRRCLHTDVPVPTPAHGQVRIRVAACGICRTDLHIVDSELPAQKDRVVLGHQIVGVVDALGGGDASTSDMSAAARALRVGDRVGVPWLGWACGTCRFCQSGQENLCDRAEFTGYHRDGGLAEYAVADARFVVRVPDAYEAVAAAPLLCAGLIGYRAFRMAKPASVLGLYGFGAAAHIIIQVARHEGCRVLAFTRPGDHRSQEFARGLGASWAGDSNARPPEELDAALVFAPVGDLVPVALSALRKGGKVVCAGIHMSDIPSFPYHLLWGERSVMSVANLTRRDAQELMALAEGVRIETSVRAYPLSGAPEALADLRGGRFEGAAVVVP